MIDPTIFGYTELKNWLRDRLNLRGPAAADISMRRDEAAYEKPADLWKGGDDNFRNDFRRALIDLVPEATEEPWTTEGLHQLTQLLEATCMYEAVQPLQEITRVLANRPQLLQRHMLALRALLALGWKGTPDFWLAQVPVIGRQWPGIIFYALSQHDERMAFAELPEILTDSNVDDVLAMFPIITQSIEGGIATMRRLATSVIDRLEPVSADRLREWFVLQDYPLEREGKGTWHGEENAFDKSMVIVNTPAVIKPSFVDRQVSELLRWSNRPRADQVQYFAEFFRSLNGEDRPSIAKMSGEIFALAQRSQDLSKVDADNLARSFVCAAHTDRKCEESLVSLRFIKSRALELTAANVATPQGLASELRRLIDSGKHARAVKRAARKCPDVFDITVATSQFHEDRLLATILRAALEGVRGPVIRPVVRKWGGLSSSRTNEQADIGILNSGAPSDEYYKLTDTLYIFKGCYAFVRTDWLAELYAGRNDQLPHIVKEILPSLLSNDSRPNYVPVNSDEELAARCWLGLSGGLFRNDVNGFAELEAPIRRCAETLGGVRPTSICGSDEPSSMDGELELFAQGSVKAFMGGALHARLIQRWWSDPEVGRVFVELLNPQLLERISPPSWPMKNILAFSQDSFGRASAPTREKLAVAIEELYRQVAKVLHKLASQVKPEISPIFRHLVSRLVSNELDDPDARWSFVTEEEDLQTLLRDDNGAWLPRVSP